MFFGKVIVLFKSYNFVAESLFLSSTFDTLENWVKKYTLLALKCDRFLISKIVVFVAEMRIFSSNGLVVENGTKKLLSRIE